MNELIGDTVVERNEFWTKYVVFCMVYIYARCEVL